MEKLRLVPNDAIDFLTKEQSDMSKTWEIICPTCGEQIEVYGDEDWIRLYELERKNWKHKAHQAFDAIWKRF